MVKKAFGSQELCNKMWRNASMLGGDRVRKEKLKIKCPKRIQFGDPLYYEDFKNEPERLKMQTAVFSGHSGRFLRPVWAIFRGQLLGT